MKVYVVTGYTDIHNYGLEEGNPRVFSTREKAMELVKNEYERWRKEYENDLQPDAIQCKNAYDCPPNDEGAYFQTDRDDIFSWSICEIEIDRGGMCIE